MKKIPKPFLQKRFFFVLRTQSYARDTNEELLYLIQNHKYPSMLNYKSYAYIYIYEIISAIPSAYVGCAKQMLLSSSTEVLF